MQRLRSLWWAWQARYQVYRVRANPWRHGGRRGKKRPTINEFYIAKNVIEYRKYCKEGWRSCRPKDDWLRATWLRLVTPDTETT